MEQSAYLISRATVPLASVVRLLPFLTVLVEDISRQTEQSFGTRALWMVETKEEIILSGLTACPGPGYCKWRNGSVALLGCYTWRTMPPAFAKPFQMFQYLLMDAQKLLLRVEKLRNRDPSAVGYGRAAPWGS
ncbi:hypothetical protein SELMODRAFT_409138 [Selaginella moellendorffii]|uniref:Uncharacterized protein n=1 Tax=Selaginella moellendorffii TaxID=88036 RepID=D8RAH2_SELML|nr:hypothetical protein SELMODRAFT_409138 [Selaginella moellendorffii]